MDFFLKMGHLLIDPNSSRESIWTCPYSSRKKNMNGEKEDNFKHMEICLGDWGYMIKG